MKTTRFRARPSTQKHNQATPENSLGPVSIADSPEARLLAEVLRQAVEDMSYTEASLAHCKHRGRARRLLRANKDAVRFFSTDRFHDWLEHFAVENIFHEETILRRVARVVGGVKPIAPHAVSPQASAHFEEPVIPKHLLKIKGWFA